MQLAGDGHLKQAKMIPCWQLPPRLARLWTVPVVMLWERHIWRSGFSDFLFLWFKVVETLWHAVKAMPSKSPRWVN